MEKLIDIVREANLSSEDHKQRVCYRLFSIDGERRIPLALDGKTDFSIANLYDFIHSNGDHEYEEVYTLRFSDEITADLEVYIPENGKNHHHGKFDFNPDFSIYLLKEVMETGTAAR